MKKRLDAWQRFSSSIPYLLKNRIFGKSPRPPHQPEEHTENPTFREVWDNGLCLI
jgi:hypothetical protein